MKWFQDIEIRDLVIRDKVKDGLIVAEYDGTEIVIADLTKGLAPKSFNEC